MSFQEAEATDVNLNGLSVVLHGALAQPTYGRNPHQVYVNMDTDPLIGPLPLTGKPASRVELLSQTSKHRANPSAIADQVILFCRANLQQGPGFPNAESTTFGHVRRFDALVNAIVDSGRGLSLKNAKALLDDDIRGGSPATRLARQRTDLADYVLSKRQMWAFPVDVPNQPFAQIGTNRDDAVNILGLGHFANVAPADVLVRWAHTLPKPDDPATPPARLPTAWDAGADKGNVYWRPGGMSYQLNRDDSGVPEVVHIPIKGEHLVAAIETLA